ncbi:o-methyltransferase [Phlyctema vagabunda]|uniref:O-methyltransferase n=1 Tax=Phlyctema vagabunda TaxID=108571 RepID=A0ABR4PGH3_9HELO
MAENGVEAVLEQLVFSLKSSLHLLTADKTRAHLDATLHNDAKLPEKRIAAMASETIDLLHQVEQLLEPAHLVLADHFLGYTNTKCLCAAVELRIPDILATGALDLNALALASKARPDRLGQIMRPLYNNGIFSFDAINEKFSNNRTSILLQSDHWTGWANWVDLYGNEFYDIARGIPASIKQNAVRSGAQINFDTDENMFAYFQAQGWVPRLHKTLGAGATAMAPGILQDYPWEEVADRTILDIGGGGGALVASLLQEHKEMKGGIFELASVVEHAKSFFSHGGQYAYLSPRVPVENLIAGDFFESIPSFEVYVMKWVLHDWEDPDALRILQNIRRAIILGPKSRLVVLESILASGRMGRLSRYGDINMMMTAKGHERTEAQWRGLVEKAGWRVTGIYPMRNAWVQAIELKV